jgi:hypothetical protein
MNDLQAFSSKNKFLLDSWDTTDLVTFLLGSDQFKDLLQQQLLDKDKLLAGSNIIATLDELRRLRNGVCHQRTSLDGTQQLIDVLEKIYTVLGLEEMGNEILRIRNNFHEVLFQFKQSKKKEATKTFGKSIVPIGILLLLCV